MEDESSRRVWFTPTLPECFLLRGYDVIDSDELRPIPGNSDIYAGDHRPLSHHALARSIRSRERCFLDCPVGIPAGKRRLISTSPYDGKIK
jgi:hypothetical protein